MDTKKEESIHCSPSTKPWNSQEIYKKDLELLIRLSKLKGWKEYAWGDAKKLDADPSGLWKGIKDDLVKEMKEWNKQEQSSKS
jgi:hypothetical protein